MLILGIPGTIPYFFGRKYGKISFVFFNLWVNLFSVFTAIRYEVRNIEKIDPKRSYIFVSNHLSYLDAPAILIKYVHNYVPLGKKELLRIPVLGQVFDNAAILVDRSSEESRKQSKEELIRVLDSGISIFIFPEGTQNRTGDLLAPFYDGAFRMAVETQTDIVPMVIINSGKLMPPNRFYIRPGKITVVYGKPFPTANKTDIKVVKAEVREIMENMIIENQ
jgi:1-acyl-sn-glycerol-3-phosphate acyltransferase